MEEPVPHNPLSEISHLFLSGLRDKQGEGRQRPVRRPPGQHSSDVSSDEILQMGAPVVHTVHTEKIQPVSDERLSYVSAILSLQVGEVQIDQACAYASHLANMGRQVAMIVLMADQLSLWCFSRDAGEPATPTQVGSDAFFEAIHELNVDVDQWLLVSAIPSSTDARARLAAFDRWIVTTTCDHEGVVEAYRSLKTASDIGRPRLSLAVLGSQNAADVQRVTDKLAGCSRQFLGWPVESVTAVASADDVTQYCVMQTAIASIDAGWELLDPFLPTMNADAVADIAIERNDIDAMEDHVSEGAPEQVTVRQPEPRPMRVPVETAPPPRAVPPVQPKVAEMRIAGETPAVVEVTDQKADEEVIELPAGVAMDAGSLLSAILKHDSQLIECPVRPPMMPDDARLAVTREGRLALYSVAEQGLPGLNRIGKAYAWAIENLSLIAMAVPQLRLNAELEPSLRLIVDHADVSAATLQPMMQQRSVKVETYRRLKWGTRRAVLLEAA